MISPGDLFTALKSLPPVQYGIKWNNPRLFLVGAGYAIECALTLLEALPRRVPPVPALLEEMSAAVSNGRWREVNGTWLATHLLSNGVFRIASSVEKLAALCYPVPHGSKKTERDILWQTVQDSTSGKFNAFMGPAYQPRHSRSAYLDDEVKSFRGGRNPRAVRYPLASCVYQADADKHRLKAPMPRRVLYLAEIGSRGLVQAVDLYCEAFQNH